MITETITDGDKVNRFIELWGRNKSKQTKKNWKSRINVYFNALNIKDINKYVSNNRDYAQDIMRFNEIRGAEMTPLTVRSIVSTVQLFLEFSGVELTRQDKMVISASLYGAKPVVNNVAPTNQQLRMIIDASNDPLEKALFLMIAHGGLRIGETLKIKISDIDMDSNPPRCYHKTAVCQVWQVQVFISIY